MKSNIIHPDNKPPHNSFFFADMDYPSIISNSQKELNKQSPRGTTPRESAKSDRLINELKTKDITTIQGRYELNNPLNMFIQEKLTEKRKRKPMTAIQEVYQSQSCQKTSATI